jgi:hypothetical protein
VEPLYREKVGAEIFEIVLSRLRYLIERAAQTDDTKQYADKSRTRNRTSNWPAEDYHPSNKHRNQTINRKGAYIISRRPSHGQFERRCCPQAFLRIFSEETYIRTVGNSTLLKIYTLLNHTITICVSILETQLLGLLYGGGASFAQKWSMPWMSANI